ncbi:MAG: hypothetical protein H7141_06015 [Burkholderiales bacterium]|nr:hypothetical protein [Bacteroidia bacterium]
MQFILLMKPTSIAKLLPLIMKGVELLRLSYITVNKKGTDEKGIGTFA